MSLLLKILNTDEKERIENYEELQDLFSYSSNYYKDQIKLILEEQKSSEEFQREKYIPWEILDEDCRSRIAKFRAVLILCIYVNHPPRRSLEYKFGEDDDMIFSGWASNWSRHVAKIFDNVVGKPLTSTDLRKLYVSHRVASGTLLYLPEKKRLACQMGHSVALQTLNYTFQPVPTEVENTVPMEVVEENTDPVVSSPPKRYWSHEEKAILYELWDEYERLQPSGTLQEYARDSGRLPADLDIDRIKLKIKNEKKRKIRTN
ncbi:hypothetical protein DFS34DRAFT_638638 [Phlyctochytrium arcticum]|nr:hypothetical protein DFS34DRAFT_638638 [Phlyctochytrium arcticum]